MTMITSKGILPLLTAVVFTYPSIVLPKESCSITSTPCQRTEMRVCLENAVTLANKVIESLNENKECTNCPAYPEDCAAVYRRGYRSSGVYTVQPRNRILKNSVQVYCDMETDGGAWTVIQRRGNFGRPQDYFYNDWNTYKEGFGDVSQDFWLGNDLLFAFTNQKVYNLRFDLKNLEGSSRWALYDTFYVDSEEYNYKLHVAGYRGNAGDSFTRHAGLPFSTKDRDNDGKADEHCAVNYKGGWWYGLCHISNLNGLYLNGPHTTFADGINWYSWTFFNYSLPFTEMKIRPNIFKPLQNEDETTNPL